ncbi:MAG: type II secretion system F family protein [Thermoplasmatota archaeon]
MDEAPLLEGPLPPVRRPIAATASRVTALLAFLCILGGASYSILFRDEPQHADGITILGVGLVLAAVSTVLGLGRTPPRDDFLATTGPLKTTTLFLQLLATLSLVLVILAVAHHLGAIRTDASPILGGEPFLVAVLATAQLIAHVIALGRPQRPLRPPGARVVGMVSALGAIVITIVGVMAARSDPTLLASHLGPPESLFILLTGVIFLALSAHAIHDLPTPAKILVAAEATALPGGRARGVVLPVVVSFSLLVLSLLLFVLFGVGVAGTLGQVARNPGLLAAFVVVLVAIAAAIMGTFRLVKKEETEAPLYRPYTDPRARLERETLWVCLGVSALFLATSVAVFLNLAPLQPRTWIHFASIGVMIGLGPYGFLVAKEANRIRRLEERFPDFLREIATSHKSGLTLAEAVTVSSRGDYGPLSPEVRRMADQVAWNVPFTEALQRFSDRVRTPLVQRAVNLILEADRSGGSSTEVLLAAARDAREIKTLENDRRITMSLYTIIIYITFFVFLGVAAVLYGQFIPQLVKSSQAAALASQGTGVVQGLGGQTLDASQFQLFYFLAAMVQALGDGIVAGMMGTGRAVLGLRHSFNMVLLTYLTFVFLLH